MNSKFGFALAMTAVLAFSGSGVRGENGNGSDRGGLAAAGQKDNALVAFGGADGVRGGIVNYENGVGNGLVSGKGTRPYVLYSKGGVERGITGGGNGVGI